MMSTARKTKWHPPPPQTPRILHLPRRTRRSRTISSRAPPPRPLPPPPPPPPAEPLRNPTGRLEVLFDQERAFLSSSAAGCERRRPKVVVDDDDDGRSGGGDREAAAPAESEEEKWRFQAEILRAECNFLRTERDIALKKLERERVDTESTLKSAVQTLVSGRRKIGRDGARQSIGLNEEIRGLEAKLQEMKTSSGGGGLRGSRIRCRNFDRQAEHLRRRLEKLRSSDPDPTEEEEEESVREIRVVPESRSSVSVERLGKKMEGLSKGMLERVEESLETSKAIKEGERCTGRCKEVVRRIAEQVKLETEQWSEMQGMLRRVKAEMDGLRCSRDFWARLADHSHHQLQSLHSSAMEWRQRARSFQSEATKLRERVSELQIELERSKSSTGGSNCSRITLSPLKKPTCPFKENQRPLLLCRVKEESHKEQRHGRSPFSDIGNHWRV